MAFMDRAGNVKPVTLLPDGSVPVASSDDEAGGAAALLARVAWELRELRRVYCEDTGQLFEEYPG